MNKEIEENSVSENVFFLKKCAKQVASIKMGHLSTCMKISSKRKRKILCQ